MDGDALEDLTQCPAPCAYCEPDGSCDDCLECLYWPEPYAPEPDNPARTAYGHAEPSFALELSRRRARLTLHDIVTLALRRHRRDGQLSQRSFAEQVGWSHTMVARAETDPGTLELHRVEEVLAQAGCRLVVVDEEGAPFVPTDATAPELLARDAAGRRLPPFAEPLRRESTHRFTQGDGVRHRGAWTWTRPH